MLLGFAGFWLVQLSGPPFLCERRGMHKIEGWSKVRGGGPKWRIQGLWAILSRSDYKLEPAESWGRLSLNEWSPQGFPPKKIWHFLYLCICFPNPQKKCQWKKNSVSLCLPRLTASHNVLLLCCHLIFTEACLLNYKAPLWVISLCCIRKWSLCKFSKYCFILLFGQLCRVVVSYKYQSGLCVCYHHGRRW